jgi:hypothetical protein
MEGEKVTVSDDHGHWSDACTSGGGGKGGERDAIRGRETAEGGRRQHHKYCIVLVTMDNGAMHAGIRTEAPVLNVNCWLASMPPSTLHSSRDEDVDGPSYRSK